MNPLRWYEKNRRKVEDLRTTIAEVDDAHPDRKHPLIALAKRVLAVADELVELEKGQTIATPARRERGFVCSPLRPKLPPGWTGTEAERAAELQRIYEANLQKARNLAARVTAMGYRPFAPHLLYPQFLDEFDDAQRALGLSMGVEDLSECQRLFYEETPTEGMQMEIEFCQLHGIPIQFVGEVSHD